MDVIKDIINAVSDPRISFTVAVILFPFIIPPSAWFEKWHRRLRLDLLWTTGGAVVLFGGLTLFFALGVMDANFRSIVTKPDNVPIVLLLYLMFFFLWLSIRQGRANDARVSAGQKPDEYSDPRDKVLVWPDLVYIELIAMVLVLAGLVVWSLLLPAPLEEPANPAVSPNPAKAPWYFLGLQEMLVYFDPWLAGVVLPTVIVIGLMSFPYIDPNPRSGYYTFAGRRTAVSMFLFCFFLLWIYLISVGTFLRGPNWNFYGPFEYWDAYKQVPLNNVNLSEYIYILGLKTGMPGNIILREIWGILLVLGYFLVLPPLLTATVFKRIYRRLDLVRYSVFIVLTLTLLAIPIKMYLRWTLNLKYIVAIPEYFLNI